jgi:hypothetical protein
LGGFVGTLLSPTHPVGRQQRRPDGDKVLLEFEEPNRLPMAGTLHVGPDGDAEAQVQERTQQRGDREQNDDRGRNSP